MSRKKKTRKDKQFEPMNIYFNPLTEVQDDLWGCLGECSVVCANGPAGTGKTFTALTKAASMMLQGKLEKIVLARANVSTGKSLGAIPGCLEEKLEPWLMPMLDVLRSYFGNELSYMLKVGKVELVSLETIRGRSFDNAFIVVDEAQQLTMSEIKAITTRIGQNSIMCLMGDPDQTDISHKTGYERFCGILEEVDLSFMSVINFSIDDIVRSDTCAALVRLFKEKGL